MRVAEIGIDDKYEIDSGRVYLTALQALIRVLIEQRAIDAAAGIATAGFVSGYRGSPVAGLDMALWRASKKLKESSILFQPGLNEELGATAVAGTQQVGELVASDTAGVFGLWYGKNPGLDRCGDVLKHANQAGTARYGGVLAVSGDDPGAKSTSTASQCEQAFMSARMPILFPATLQDYLDYGLFGFALSRYSGCWIGIKTVSQTVEASGTALIDRARWRYVEPADFQMPPDAPRPLSGYGPLRDEARLVEVRLPGAQAFARANAIDHVVFDSPRRRLGIVCAGKTYLDVRQALAELEIDEAGAAALGLRIYKLGMIWPIEPQGLCAFADGHEELIIFEEKQSVIEAQVAQLLYNRAHAPGRIVGKRDEADRPLVSAIGELSPTGVARVILARLKQLGIDRPVPARLAAAHAAEERSLVQPAPALARTMFYCSGCPHNTSTRIPEGSRAMGGIGCSSMAMLMPDRRTALSVQMGGEGVNWIGQAPFAKEKHVFQNLGDGTYVHSGLLAIRAAVAANVNITYKILYNDAIAMTGGQPLEGHPSVAEMVWQVHSERVRRIALVSDQPEQYDRASLPQGVTIHHRRVLDSVQKELRTVPGVSVLLYEQTCAAEKRRRRKRGTFPDPDLRLYINPDVCEGCGDCTRASNCISVQPLETPLGRKRKIDQSNCNKDYSCLAGFCPSFVSVRGAKRKALGRRADLDAVALAADLPAPAVAVSAGEPYNLLLAGVGGTGILTLSALLGMAAHIDGLEVTVLDETGIAQKNGAVSSHMRFSTAGRGLYCSRIVDGHADLLLACDSVVAAGQDILRCLSAERTRAVVNSYVLPPASFIADNEIDLSPAPLLARIDSTIGPENVTSLDATGIAGRLTGDSIAGNIFLLGFALQRGLIPVSYRALSRAIELNGTSVDLNQQALAWGRVAAVDAKKIDALVEPGNAGGTVPTAESFDTFVAGRAAFLTAYQNRAYADRYLRLVGKATQTEERVLPGRTEFSWAVARNFSKLMAYKDEYEVARLFTAPAFKARMDQEFEGDYKLSLNLAPPLLARMDAKTGIPPSKREYGAWMFPLLRLLAMLRRVRGTPFDPAGYTQERRQERQLIVDYERGIAELCDRLAPATHELATRIASIPDQIRGFGHIKHGNIEKAAAESERLFAQLRRSVRLPEPASS